MGIKLYGCLLMLLITAFSRHFRDVEFEERVIIFILPISGKRQLMQITILELTEIQTSFLKLIYAFCRNLMDMRTGEPNQNFQECSSAQGQA